MDHRMLCILLAFVDFALAGINFSLIPLVIDNKVLLGLNLGCGVFMLGLGIFFSIQALYKN